MSTFVTNLRTLAFPATVVFGIAVLEGALFINPHCVGTDLERILFCVNYGYENLFASCIWVTKDANLIAQSMGLNHEEFIENFSLHANTAEDATKQLRIQGLYVARSLVAGFTLISQVVKVSSAFVAAKKSFTLECEQGKQIIFPEQGVVMRLMGERSDMTSLSLQRLGTHILPMVERPELLTHWLWRHAESDMNRAKSPHYAGRLRPLFWRTPSGAYGSKRTWARMKFHPEWLIRTSTGRSVLVLEADSTNSEQGLVHKYLNPERGDGYGWTESEGGWSQSASTDLTIEDATLGFRHLELNANLQFRQVNLSRDSSHRTCPQQRCYPPDAMRVSL